MLRQQLFTMKSMKLLKVNLHCLGYRVLHFFSFFVNFVVQKPSTMKSTKSLKETLTLPWRREIEALLFFTVLAHGIARSFMSFMSFMVDSLSWRLPCPS